MKVSAELMEITEEMTNKKLVEALNKNFQELKETSENRDQVMLNSIGNLEKQIRGTKSIIENLQSDMIKGFNNSNEKINALDTKINQVSKNLGDKLDNIIDRLGGIENLLTE